MNLPHKVKYTEDFKKGGDSRLFFIRIKPKYKDDAGLHAHEYEHVKQWYLFLLIGLCISAPLTCFVHAYFFPLVVLSIWLKGVLYTHFRPARLWMEVKAFRVQLKHSPHHFHYFVRYLVNNYDLNINDDKAERLLTCH